MVSPPNNKQTNKKNPTKNKAECTKIFSGATEQLELSLMEYMGPV